MDDQEMQFADPAWQPPQQRGNNVPAQNQEPYIPQPVNSIASEQPQWQNSSAEAQPDQSYTDTSYTGYQAQALRGSSTYARPQQRRRRNPLLWIVLAFIIIMVLSGSFRMGFDGFDMHGGPSARPAFYVQPQRDFKVGIHPTIIITDPNGSISVHAGGSTNIVTVQTHQDGAGTAQVPSITQGDNDSLNISVDNSGDSTPTDIDVTVANEADLVLQTDSGNIDVSDVSGQLSLTSESGTITTSQVTLARDSLLQTDSGSIISNGNIASEGNYQFTSKSGSIVVTLAGDTAFHVDATTISGSFNSDFPEVSSQPPNAHEAHGNVGNSPHATITIKTDSGAINLQKAA